MLPLFTLNEITFLLHTFIIAASCLVAFRLGKEALVGFICIQGILANLFVTKQMTLFGMDVTCSDVFIVGCLFGLNILQEFFGKEIVKKVIAANFFVVIFYLFMSQMHLWYLPNTFDSMHQHFTAILGLMPRITIASVIVFLFVQILDSKLYATLKTVTQGRYSTLRNMISLSFSQFIDTTLFAFAALYGVVGSVWHIIFVSFAIKVIAIMCTAPFMKLAKRINPNKEI